MADRPIFRIDIPVHLADVIRLFHPDLKRSVRAAIDEIAINPHCGEPLRGELEGMWKYRVRRFRIVYEVERTPRTVRLLAVAPRREVYEEMAARVKTARSKK